MPTKDFTFHHHQQLFEASNKLLTKATVPILRYENDQLLLNGTGVFLRIGDRHFILTAAHVLDASVYRRTPIVIGLEYVGGPPIVLDGGTIWQSDFPDGADVNDPEARLADPFDNAFIAIKAEHAQSLSKLRTPITLQEVDLAEKPKAGCFLLLGYPGNYAQSSTIIGRTSVEYLRYITEIDTTNDPGNEINVLFKYLPGSVHSDGTKAKLPDAHGISGCGVWRLSTPKPFEQWSLDDVKLVATEHEWHRTKHFVRTTPIVHTIRAIYQNLPEIRTIMDINLGTGTVNWL